MTGFAMVWTAVADPGEAGDLARALVDAKLTACVQIVPIASVYRWQGEIEEASEQMLVCKIAAADFSLVEAAIRERHAYDVPEIIMTPIVAGHQPYLDWLGAAVAR